MNYKYLIILSFFIITEAFAADGLGRLFLTPEQRAQLDIVRARRDPRQPLTAEPVAAQTTPTPPAAPQGPDTVTYNGVVRRSDGKSTVWINGKPLNERNRSGHPNDVNVLGMRADGAVSVAVPQASRTASLKVGQRLDVGSGRVEEGYFRREMPPQLAVTPDAQGRPATASLTPAPATADGKASPTRAMLEADGRAGEPTRKPTP
jgi:hypothetical protein